jgi:hypothetical protein
MTGRQRHSGVRATLAPLAARIPLAPPLALVERALVAGLAGGNLAATLLVVKNALAPAQWPSTFGLEFGRWLGLAHLAAALGAALVAVLARLWSEAVAAAVVRAWPLTVLTAAWIGNARVLEWFGAVDGRFRALLVAAWVLAQAALVAGVLFSLRRRWLLRLLAGSAAAAFVLAVWPQPTARSSARVASPALRLDADPLLVFGIDGADWAYVEPLIARGLMPNLARLRAEGAWGPLQSMKPTASPVIWTTIATGQPPRRHGVRGFTVSRMRGVQAPLRRLKPVRLLGYEALLPWLTARGVLFEAPVSTLSRREPALWNLMADAGRPVSLLNWWVTWPAEPVLGRVVSERLYYWRFAERGWGPEKEQLTHPPALAAEVAADVVPPDAVQYEQARPFVDVDRAEFDLMMKTAFSKHMLEGELRYFLSMYETNRRVARRLVQMDLQQYGRPADLLVLERLVDMACHAALAESELVEDHLGASEQRRRKFGRVVTAAYAAVDRQLGELLEVYRDGNVVVLSDHGFHLVSHWPDWNLAYDHSDAPAGIFVARGPAFTPGRVDGLGVYDVFPLLARLKGLPVADDLAGRVPEQVLSASARARPIHRVAHYGAAALAAEGDAAGEDKEMMERLRALGYVQ